ncbi:MAG: ATP-grasp domain-containing protein [Bacteroidaceae bacterium]|nr:ATP-grasp domain-containing protein [Bacteroidaceae bacterium]
MNILLLGSGTQALAILKSISESGNQVIMLISEVGNYADVSKYVSERILTHYNIRSSEFLELIKSIITEKKVNVVIPMGDIFAEFLSVHREELLRLTNFKIPSYDYFLDGYDKNKLMSLCAKRNYPHPYTIDLSVVDYKDPSNFKLFPYPGILKPNCTTGGRGMCLINKYDEFINVYPKIKSEYGECHLQQFIRGGGRQVKIQLFVNEERELLYSSVMEKVRWYPIKGGSSSCAVTIRNPQIVETCCKILKDIHWVGFADFDTIENPDTGELLIMEINPRLPACIGAAINAGMDWGRIIIDDALGVPPKRYLYKDGIVLRHLGFDLLWFLKSTNRFKTKPNWFLFFGKRVYYQDFHFWDQKPFWVGTYHNIKKMFSPEFIKAKSGTSSI